MLENSHGRGRHSRWAADATAERLLDAAEAVIRRARVFSDVTVRRIAGEAGVNVSSIAYHFGSLEGLTAAVASRVYDRLNAERLGELQKAVDRAAPNPPAIEDVVAALVGPSVRWSLDSDSPYPVLIYVNRMLLMSEAPERYRGIIENVEHHRAFVRHLHRIAPWYDRVEIGWRLNAALGIRSQVTRHRRRSAVLTEQRMDLADADTVIAALVDVIVPMFAEPRRARPAGQTASERRHCGATKRA